MNALVVFCHFCEQHGPSVVMCTQPYRQLPARPNGSEHSSHSDYPAIRRATSHVVLYGTGGGGSGDNLLLSDAPSGPLVFAADAACPGLLNANTSPGTSQQPLLSMRGTCRACTFTTRDEPGLVSQDQAANISYSSTQLPKDPDLLHFVRTACQRSLSSEVSPSPEGAFYFGDEINGHVVSYNFGVKDSQARGFQGRFSILVLSWDRLYLLNLWPFLISNLSEMASRIKQAAERVFASETSGGAGTSASRPVATNAHPSREATPPAFCGQAIAAGTATPMPVSTVGGGPAVRHRRAGDSDMRSLCDLTRDEKIFYRIHAWFTWLLRAGARHWTALPSLTAVPDEDSLVEQEERQALNADPLLITQPFVNVTTAPGRGSSSVASGSSSGQLYPSGPTPIPPVGMVGNATMSVGKSLGITNGSAEEETALALLVLTRLMHALGVKRFSSVVQNLAVGNQLVVQPLDDDLHGCLVVAAMAKLLPKACRKQIVTSPEYLPTFRCNLLSLTVDAKPPEPDWTPSDGVQFLAVCRNQSPAAVELAAADEQLVHSLQFRLCTTLPSIDPQLASLRQASSKGEQKRTLSALPNTTLPSTPVGTFANRIVQLLSVQPPLPASAMDLALSAIRQEWINKARLLYSFKRCQGPTLTGEDTTRRWAAVLSSIDCSAPENANVVRFWQGALSQYSRHNTCHSHRRVPGSSNTSRRGSCCSSNADLAAAIAATSLVD
ncbi:hypothetical protein CRM22_005326 [Opisthorchis felineus]|uniref:Folliculin n=2 Tax=Opisthorchis felineus TaxID=147828 RepID=A0A4S2LXF2_OPIFE|nr:hypothetical protein CRM22_005326 [Opisthorchis felineus]